MGRFFFCSVYIYSCNTAALANDNDQASFNYLKHLEVIIIIMFLFSEDTLFSIQY